MPSKGGDRRQVTWGQCYARLNGNLSLPCRYHLKTVGELQWRSEGLQRPGANACIGAPPPPELAPPLPHRPTRLAPLGLGVRPPSPFGKSCIRPWEKNRQAKKKGLQQEKGTFAARLIRHCNEVTLIICLGLIFFLKFAPISAGAPSKACARGHAPPYPPPPPRYATGELHPLSTAGGCD